MQLGSRVGFLHQRLDVYHVAQELVGLTYDITADLPRGFAELRDQARRAALAVVRHIAEAASRVSNPDKRQRFVVARGEAAELHATIESAAHLAVVPVNAATRVIDHALRVGAMLSSLVRRLA